MVPSGVTMKDSHKLQVKVREKQFTPLETSTREDGSRSFV
jgi:hypothetical protein